MRSFRLCLLFAFLYTSISAQPLLSGAGNPQGPVNIYAVVVGISTYQDSAIDQLQFANADAIEFARFLKSKTGGSVPNENIRLLTDSNATQSAVLLAVNWLRDVCKKDDIVFFYFSGHGAIEHVSMFNNAFLICYNTLKVLPEGMSLSADKLNDVAKTLSAQTLANVVLITDACHSGETVNDKARNKLLGEQLLASTEKEIRIASCKPDQLSNENTDWGGGRGVFSYYLVNGLNGFADADKDGVVTLGEVKTYLENALKNDPLLLQENKIQTPVFKDDNDKFQLAKIDPEEFARAKARRISDSIANTPMLTLTPFGKTNNDVSNEEPDEYFFKLLKSKSLEAVTDSLHLAEISADEIPFALINGISSVDVPYTHNNGNFANAETKTPSDKLKELADDLRNNTGALTYFKERLVRIFDDRAHDVINQYLNGDEAELERRRYYNIKNNGYDVYPRMFAVALKLITPDNLYYNILQVKLHYFTGVTLRLKVPVTENPAPLIAQALSEQQQALALNAKAPQVNNELGILYLLKNDNATAEKYFIKATQLSDSWALPWANLAGLYAETGQYAKGFAANLKADSLQKGLQGVTVNSGYLNERSGNLLYAEEDYRKAIDMNSRHYLPFERLGYVYLKTAKYALADSFFYEADLRKKGFHFESGAYPGSMDKQLLSPSTVRLCDIDTNLLRKDDIMAFFTLGVHEYLKKYYRLNKFSEGSDSELVGEYFAGTDDPFSIKEIPDYSLAIWYFKKVIRLDKRNPLVYYYLGKVYFAQKQWEKAELMFRYAIQNHLDTTAFKAYFSQLHKGSYFPYPHDCFENSFFGSQYPKIDNYYFLASLYESWQHFDESESCYKKIIQEKPKEIEPYIKLWQLLEKQNRYAEAEDVVQSFSTYDQDRTKKELNAFYRRAITKYPNAAEWNYKLGLLLYSLSQKKSLDCLTDTIIWFSKINKEIFLGSDGYSGDRNDLDEDTGPGVSHNGCGFFYSVTKDSTQLTSMPVTEEKLPLSGSIYYPRYDGIKYLKRAAELISVRELLGEINYKIGNMYIWAGSKKQAYPFLAKSLEFVPDNANTRLQIVDVSASTYRNRVGLEQLSFLYDSSQINFQNRLLFSELAMYAGQFDKSKKVLNEADAINPYPLTEITDLNGRLAFLSGKTKEAIAFYKAIVNEKPGDSYSCYSLARLYAIEKNNKEAMLWLKQAINKGFNYSFILKYDPVMDNLRHKADWITATSKMTAKDWKRSEIDLDGNPN